MSEAMSASVSVGMSVSASETMSVGMSASTSEMMSVGMIVPPHWYRCRIHPCREDRHIHPPSHCPRGCWRCPY